MNPPCLQCVYTLTYILHTLHICMYIVCTHLLLLLLPTSAARVRHFEMTGKDGDNDKAFQPAVVVAAAALVLRCCCRRRILQYFFTRVSHFKCFLTFMQPQLTDPVAKELLKRALAQLAISNGKQLKSGITMKLYLITHSIPYDIM